MNTIDLPSKKKLIIKLVSLVVVSSIMVISCYAYHKYDTYKSIKVVVNKKAAVEYGSANYDINKLIKKVEGEIVSVKQDIDTKKIGKQEVVVEVKKENVTKEVAFVVNVMDTTAPEVKIKEEKVTITEGDDYDLTSNVESVKDDIDGDITYLNEVKEDSNFYYNFSYGEDIDNVGSHEVIVNAKDKHGNVTQTKFTLEVKAKPVTVAEPSAPVNANAPANAAGGDIVSIAYSLVGSPYVSGSNGPYGFDCSGFVQYVYSRVGKSVSRSSYTQAYDGVGVSYSNAQPGDILSWGHGGSVTHSALYVGNGLMIHATNPSQGVVVSSVSGWQNGSIDNLMAVRRVN